jgi:RimJ/RimL family protein N-acetyltransferase
MCTEAVAGLISWAFTDQREGGWGLRRIEIFCARRNLASQRVPQKLGLRQEVHRRQAGWIEGLGWEDQLGWGVVRDEWRPRTEPPA